MPCAVCTRSCPPTAQWLSCPLAIWVVSWLLRCQSWPAVRPMPALPTMAMLGSAMWGSLLVDAPVALSAASAIALGRLVVLTVPIRLLVRAAAGARASSSVLCFAARLPAAVAKPTV